MLDRSFNAAVLAIASHILPRGFDVSDNAPSTYDELRQHYQATGRILVWSGASDRTIFGDPEVNHAFRAWHDARHILGAHDFSFLGECRTCFAQIADMEALFRGHHRLPFWRRLLRAEVIGQAYYVKIWGEFPADQSDFVECYLRSPPLAFANPPSFYR
jgi:hypothetical protein